MSRRRQGCGTHIHIVVEADRNKKGRATVQIYPSMLLSILKIRTHNSVRCYAMMPDGGDTVIP